MANNLIAFTNLISWIGAMQVKLLPSQTNDNGNDENLTSKEYDNLINLIECNKPEAWQRLLQLMDSGDKIAQGIGMIFHTRGTYKGQKDVAKANMLAATIVPWLLEQTTTLTIDSRLECMICWILGHCYKEGIHVAKDNLKQYE